MLAWGGNAWHLVEFAIAIGAGVAAGSVALIVHIGNAAEHSEQR